MVWRAGNRHSHDGGADEGGPVFSDAGELLGPVETGRTDIEEEELVFLFVEDGAAESLELDKFRLGQFAEKNAELNMLAMVLQGLEHTGPALVVGHVVGAEVESAVIR